MSADNGTSLSRPLLAGALIAASAVPQLLNTIPAVTAVLEQSVGAGPGMLAAFATAESAGMAIGSLLAVTFTRSGSPRLSFACGLALLIVANLLSMFVPWGMMTIVLRCLGGLGAGLVLSATNYIFGFGNVERNYALYMLGFMGLSALVMPSLPFLSSRFGWQSMFLLFSLLVIPALGFFRLFPLQFLASAGGDTGAGPAMNTPAVVIGLGAVFLSTMGQLSLFTYLGNMGFASGFTMTEVATGLSYSAIGALVGAIGSIAIGARVSRIIPFGIIILATIAGVQASGSHNFVIYTLGISVFFFTIPLYTCAQFGLLMRHAPNQSFAVSILAAQLIAAALAPALGGAIIAGANFVLLRMFCDVGYLAAFVLLIVYVRRARPQSDEEAGSSTELPSPLPLDPKRSEVQRGRTA